MTEQKAQCNHDALALATAQLVSELRQHFGRVEPDDTQSPVDHFIRFAASVCQAKTSNRHVEDVPDPIERVVTPRRDLE